MTDEELVRSKWEDAGGDPFGDPPIYVVAEHAYRFNDYAAAAEFTRRREEEIRQVWYEIECLDMAASLAEIKGWDESWIAIWKRIIAREQATLAELKRGWRN